MSHTAFDYQYTEEGTHWDWNGCHYDFEVKIPYPCGIKYKTVCSRIPWGIEWCSKTTTISTSYPCGIKYKTVWGRRIPWGMKWCSKTITISTPYPCGIKYKTVCSRIPWGIKWCSKTITTSIPYPCFVTTIITRTGHACRGTGQDILSIDLDRFSHHYETLPDPDGNNNDGDTLYAVYRKGLISRHITRNGRVLPEVALESLNDFENVYLFCWDDIPGKDDGRLLEYLEKKYRVDWVRTAKIDKFDDCQIKKIGTIKVSTITKSLWLRLNYEKTKVYLKSYDGTTDEFIAKNEDGKLNIYEIVNYHNKAYLRIERSDKSTYLISFDNVRYSTEFCSDSSIPSPSNRLWVPVIGPVKNPGNSNDGRYVISGNDDNPLYYGSGLALAIFSLEALHGVSDYSIKYARLLIKYCLLSEMSQGNGYIIRKSGFFHSNRNENGEPVIQGASSEELLGLMLGIMFYLKAEKNKDHPLYQEAKRLRDDVLKKVSKGRNQLDYYEHPFMISAHLPSYRVKHFEFPLYAPKEYRSGTWFFDQVEQYYITSLTLAAGRTRTVGSWVGDPDFQDYMMYLTSMILVLEGNIPKDKKKWFAEVYMRDFIKAATTHGPDIHSLVGNLYMALVAKLANKYLSGNSEYESEKLRSIWGDYYITYRDLVSPLEVPIQDLATNMPIPHPEARWQPNLPFEYMKPYDQNDLRIGWHDHNVTKGIGSHFIWRYENDKYYWQPKDYWGWFAPFPGYGGTAKDWLDFGDAVDEATFKSSNSKKYRSYFSKELVQARNHTDNQIEGAGLDLLFMRMFLTHINPTAYPPPILPEQYNKEFRVLPFDGAEPLDPIKMYKTFEYSSKDDPCGAWEIRGDRDKALRIVNLGEEHHRTEDFIIAYATDGEKLKLKHGFISYGSDPKIPPGIYLDSKGTVWKRFDQAIVKWTENENHDNILVVAERAEGDRKLRFSTDIFQRKHWLRLSIWRVPPFGDGSDPNPVHLNTWRSDEEDVDALKVLDMAILDRNYIAVLYRTQADKDRIRIFRINFADNSINEEFNGIINEKTYNRNQAVTTAYKDIIIYTHINSDGWQISSSRWTGNTLEDKYQYRSKHRGKLIDITTVGKFEWRSGQIDHQLSKYYVVVVWAEDVRHSFPFSLGVHNCLEVESYEVQTDGSLIYKGSINTVDEKSLVPREGDWERGSVESFHHHFYDSGGTIIPGFVIVGKGVGREMRNKDGKWKKTAKGLKVVYGYLLPDGRPTLENSNLAGSGDSSAMSMLDVTCSKSPFGADGVITVNKTKRYGGFLGIGSKYYMSIRFWRFWYDNKNCFHLSWGI